MKRAIAPVLFLLLITAGCGDPSIGNNVGDIAPPIDTASAKWITYSGKPPEADGKVKLVEFWYGACSNCCNAAPVLQILHKQNKDKGLLILAPGLDHADLIKAFRNQFGVTYPMLPNSRDLAEAYGVKAYPMMFIIGKDGIIKWKGHSDDGKFSKTLKDALAEP